MIQPTIAASGATRRSSRGEAKLTSGSLHAKTIDHFSGGAFHFTGGTLSVEVFTGNLTQEGGTLEPGSSVGTTTITGTYQMEGGSVAIELDGTIAGVGYDLVTADQIIIQPGVTLDVTRIGGFQLFLGDTFIPVASVSGRTGQFEIINLPSLDPGLDWLVSYDSKQIFLDIITLGMDGLPGDFNDDGVVDAADYPVWRDNLGALTETVIVDNGDGIGGVDIGDYTLWQTNFGRSLADSATLTTVTVPEPPTIAGLVFFATLLGARRSLVLK